MFFSLFPNLSIQPDGQIVPNAPVRDKTLGEGWQELPRLSCRYLLNLPKKSLTIYWLKYTGGVAPELRVSKIARLGGSGATHLRVHWTRRTHLGRRLHCAQSHSFCTVVYYFSALLYIIFLYYCILFLCGRLFVFFLSC